MKVTSADFKNFTDWQRYILRTQPVIPKDCRRTALIGFCLALAIHGTQGLDCYASDSLLGREIGMARRHLAKYRRLAIELGWFRPNGRKVNRVESLDIAIPPVAIDVPETAEEPAGFKVGSRRPVRPVCADLDGDPWAEDSADDSAPWDVPEVVTSDAQPG
jgi:hypothetical protein